LIRQPPSKRQEEDTLQKISSFFEICIDRLMAAEFEVLCDAEAADVDRFRCVETKIGGTPPPLRPFD
jgi:hypothetical protein